VVHVLQHDPRRAVRQDFQLRDKIGHHLFVGLQEKHVKIQSPIILERKKKLHLTLEAVRFGDIADVKQIHG